MSFTTFRIRANIKFNDIDQIVRNKYFGYDDKNTFF